MRISLLSRFLLGGAAAGAMLAGCSSGASQLPATSTAAAAGASVAAARHIPSLRLMIARLANPNAMHPKAFIDVAAVNAPHGNQTIVSSLSSNTVTIWGGDRQLNGILYTGLDAPVGIATDAAETLYVANAIDNNILIYPKPYKSYDRVLTDFGAQPLDVAVSRTGIVAVTNPSDTTNGGYGSVSIYAKGASTPCVKLSNPGWKEIGYDAFDKAGNIFINGINTAFTKVLIGEISGGCKAKAIRNVSIGNALEGVGGIQIYDGKMLVLDPAGVTLYSYNLPVKGSTGLPVARTLMSHLILPTTFAMLVGDPTLWVSDEYGSVVDQFAYPSGSPLKALDDGLIAPFGVAVNPAQNP
jgi:hypothetical protein